jgi:hypothetical protein
MAKKVILIVILAALVFVPTYLYVNKTKKVTTNTYAPVATPTPEAKSTMRDYKNTILGFEISFPDALSLEEKTQGEVVIIDKDLLIYELSENPEECTGVCSKYTKKEDVAINNIKMRKLEGYWDELGEDNAQSFVSYVIKRDEKYLVFLVQELPIDQEFIKDRTAGKISDRKLVKLDSIIKTIKL